MSEPRNFQKVCDVHDFFDPAMLRFVERDLRVEPSLRRRSWEFASIFLALQQAGMLDGTKVGLGMGVGTERLIYALSPYVRRAILTDLYQVDSRWVAVRTEDPNAMLRARAPWEVDWSKLHAARMDMRALDLGDAEVDFAWSTGAMEHIGSDADFVRHFDEVHRVLKPGGVYVFTTAVAFEDETVRFPNNYLFHPQHLLDLIARSRLHAAPVFDCTVRPHSLNNPAFEDLTEFGLNLPRQSTPHVISFRRGIITTANCMVLTKEPTGPQAKLLAFEKTRERLRQRARALLKTFWGEPQGIRLDREAVSPALYFGEGRYEVAAEGAAGLRVLSRAKAEDARFEPVTTTPVDGPRTAVTFDVEADRIYRIAPAKRKLAWPRKAEVPLRLMARRIS